jgi:hypothetical protein
VNRQDRVKEIARREALASAWVKSAKELRAEVEAEALAEYEENGNGVTWTMRDLGKVTLPLSTEAPVISDVEALTKWAKIRHPENVETVEQVRAAFQTWLLQNAEIVADGVVMDPETGEVIPGMAVREGGKPKALTITVERPVKELLANYATTSSAYGRWKSASPSGYRTTTRTTTRSTTPPTTNWRSKSRPVPALPQQP